MDIIYINLKVVNLLHELNYFQVQLLQYLQFDY